VTTRKEARENPEGQIQLAYPKLFLQLQKGQIISYRKTLGISEVLSNLKCLGFEVKRTIEARENGFIWFI